MNFLKPSRHIGVILLAISTLLALSSIFLSFKVVKAQSEHSLRPNPADPWNTEAEDLAYFCGNDLLLKETITKNKSEAVECEELASGKERCRFIEGPTSTRVAIDLSGADLPIAGNTELVTNSESEDDISDAEKVNEYVSWYLNGVTGRAEYGPLNSEVPEDASKIVDYSGPLKKLLPHEVQTRARIETIKKADSERHDQVVGCTYSIKDTNFGNLPGPCYHTGLLSDIFLDRNEVRLSDWKNNLPPVESDYDNHIDYWEAYQEWRGNFCLTPTVPAGVPFIGGKTFMLFCGVDNPFSANYYANLFPYVPFSSTEDRVGEVEAETVSPQIRGDVTVSDVSFDNQQPAELFFAHMEEVDELASLLQSTYLAKDKDGIGGSELQKTTESCDLAQVRSNPGDDLFAGEIAGTLRYTAEFTCDFDPPEVGGSNIPCGGSSVFGSITSCPAPEVCRNNRCVRDVNTNPTCSKDIYVSMNVITKTPLVDNVWDKLVAGNAAVFKRMFPKLGPDSPVLSVLDIPAATKVNYQSTGSGPQLVQAGNPGAERSGEDAELYFPHLGGVHEYFLKGIQTALRPKGFGETILSGQPIASGENQNFNQCGGQTMEDIEAAIGQASSKYGVPAKLLEAVFWSEGGPDFVHSDGAYVCEKNYANAAGIMQITDSAYNLLTCDSEKLTNDIAQCEDNGNKLSRCDFYDAMELAARTLLWKDGKWLFGECRQNGSFSTDKQSIYDAACNYYGSKKPDNITRSVQKSIPPAERRQDGDMNYCDIVCWRMGLCPSYPAR